MAAIGASRNFRGRRTIRLVVFLLSLGFSAAAFLAFDWLYSPAILRSSLALRKSRPCGVRDAVRDHALKPNCSTMQAWGGDSYAFFTNSLGFRDEKVQEVPLVGARPRILVLGDSFTEGESAWQDTYVGRIAAHFPQYRFLNGGLGTYSPSNYLNVARMVLAEGVRMDEVIVFIDNTSVQDEAAFYRDVGTAGAVTGPARMAWNISRYAKLRFFIARNLLLTNDIAQFLERFLVAHGHYHLITDQFGDLFDHERTAWSYRKVNETAPYPAGYAPLGVEGGIAKEKAKMTLLWQELQKRNIPISVVVYPYPAELVHDTVDSRQVRMWRDWCEGKCKRFITLFPAFFAVKDQCPRLQPGCWYQNLFIFRDSHYSAAGNALVADAVIKSLTEEPPVKRPAAVP